MPAFLKRSAAPRQCQRDELGRSTEEIRNVPLNDAPPASTRDELRSLDYGWRTWTMCVANYLHPDIKLSVSSTPSAPPLIW